MWRLLPVPLSLQAHQHQALPIWGPTTHARGGFQDIWPLPGRGILWGDWSILPSPLCSLGALIKQEVEGSRPKRQVRGRGGGRGQGREPETEGGRRWGQEKEGGRGLRRKTRGRDERQSRLDGGKQQERLRKRETEEKEEKDKERQEEDAETKTHTQREEERHTEGEGWEGAPGASSDRGQSRDAPWEPEAGRGTDTPRGRERGEGETHGENGWAGETPSDPVWGSSRRRQRRGGRGRRSRRRGDVVARTGGDRGQKWNVGLGMRLTDAWAPVSAGAVGC